MFKTKMVKFASLIAMLVICAIPLYASNWDIAGKILTGIEGTRLLSGGRIDIIGYLTGVNNNRYWRQEQHFTHHFRRDSKDCCTRVWIPTTVWKKKWIPTHREYNHGREIIVKGHYVEYEVETGGYWQISCPSQKYCYHCHRR